MPQAIVWVKGGEKLRITTTRPFLTKSIIRGWLPKSQIAFDWDEREWRVAFSKLDAIVEKLLDAYGRVEIRTRHSKRQTCTPSCQTAVRNRCVCSCRGENHKKGDLTSFYRHRPDQVIDLGTVEEEVVRILTRP